ncbi:hypothetical protein GCM10023116_20580 [Kistimonas scapharcae]|uniref:TnsA endonuclease N-terminal domain-containing protein n=1 Tax=Kistimonas scapharcae TaxID=1036133 RepID=A0ABP8V1S6_9GAMM
MDLAKNVVEIREQFPLKRSLTLAIAEKLKIKHPSQTDYNTKKPIAIYMTTDFLVTLLNENGQEYHLAVSVKPTSELRDDRVLAKQKIEYAYWSLQGIRFSIITDQSFNSEVSDNLELIHQSYCTVEQNKLSLPGSVNVDVIEHHILSTIKSASENETISEMCKKINAYHGCSPGVTLTIFYRMIAVRKIDINMVKLSIGAQTDVLSLKKYLVS